MKKSAVVLLIALALPGTALAAQFSIHAEEWARPRSGEAVRELPAMRDLMREFDRQPGASVEIRYPGGEAGVLWALEVTDWLVALGVPSDRIRSAVGSGVEDSVQLLLLRKDETQGTDQ